MSTAGSTRSGEPSQYRPPESAADATPAKKKRTKIFRSQGILPLLLVGVLVVGGWTLFGDRVIRATIVEAAGKALGTQVDIASLNVRTLATTVELRGIALADPFDVNRNLLEVGRFVLEMEPKPLLQKKVVVKRLTIADVKTGTRRAIPARQRPAGEPGLAQNALVEVRKFAAQFKVPLMQLVPIDSLKALVLNPEDLKAVQAALALAANADSAKTSLERGYAALRLQPTLDSSQAVIQRLQGANLRTLGVEGVRNAANDIRRAIARVDSARGRVDRLVVDTRRSVDSLQAGVVAIDVARREDYEHARSLLKLPSFDSPDVGAAVFGAVTIDKFQQAMYWATLARQYAPPGLLPKEKPGPSRVRASGTTVNFVRPESYPTFLLRRADLTFEMPNAIAGGTYAMAISDATTDPAILGRPTLFAVRRTTKSAPTDSVRITGSLDHVGARPRETVAAAASGIGLPVLSVPALPYTLNPGKGSAELRFSLDGDQISGRWTVRSQNVTWQPDSARARRLNTMESLVARVLTGIDDLEMTAEIGGTVSAPRLAVRSNLDRQVGERLRAVAGQEIAAAQARVRAQVDRIVEEKSAPVKARVAEVRAEGERRVADARTKLDDEKRKLEDRLRAFTSGLPRLPGVGL